MFYLKFFGGASIEGPDGPLSGRGVQRRRLALLSLLAGRARGFTRERLAALLWPDAGVERARHQLSDSVYRINQAVGGEAVSAAGDALRLNQLQLPSDVDAFATAIERADWRRAVELSAAPFLDGFSVPDCGEYERWVDGERARLLRERARALEALANQAEQAGDLAEAVGWWRTLAADDPFSSRIALRLMRALDAAGERSAALRHARVHTLLVRDEIGVEPDVELAAFADSLRSSPAAEPPAPAARTPPQGPPTNEADGPTAKPSRPAFAAASSLPGDGAETAPVADGVGGRRAPRWWGASLASLAVVAVALVVVAWQSRSDDVPAPSSATQVAVLPFEDLSAAGDQEYFAEGITEELLVRLSRVAGLEVIGRTTAFAFQGQALDVRAVADSLGVSVVLVGSVQQSGNRLRIFAQLVDGRSGFALWSQTYERQRADVFAIQDDIARAIVTQLRGGLAGEDAKTVGVAAAVDPDVYNLYLQGRFEWHKRTEEGLRNAARLLREAVDRAPTYARAWAGLGDAYAVLGFYDYLPPAEAFPAAAEAANRALAIDATLAEPHATLGYVALYHAWDWERAEEEFRRTLDLGPRYSTGHQWYANFLTAMGRFDDAVRAMRAAQELDPLSLIANAALGFVLYYAGDYAEATDQLSRTLELDPDFQLAYLWRGLVRLEAGESAAAFEDLERAVALSGGAAINKAALAYAHAVVGEKPRALELLRELEDRAGQVYAPSFEIAKIHEALGDRAAALRWLERAYEERAHSIAFLAVDPQLRALRGEPAFERLLRRVRLDARPLASN